MIWVVFWLSMGWVTTFIWLLWYYRDYPEYQATLERCEEQHRALMEGREHYGTYGDYPPVDLIGTTTAYHPN